MMQGNTSTSGGAARRDSIEAGDFAALFVRQWRWALATFVVVALIATTAPSLVKPQWEAQVTIRLGQVYDALSGAVRPIEPLQDVLERMRVGSFLRDALKGKAAPPGDPTQDQVPPIPRVDTIAPTGLIRIAARGSSAEEARSIAVAMFNHLASVHGELARAARSEAELLAGEYAEGLAGLREVQSNLQKAFSSANRSDAVAGPTALATIASAMERNANETRDLELQKFLLIRRNEYQSAPTEMIGEVSTLKLASVPRGLVVMFGLVMGLAAGSVVALLRDYFVRMRSQLA